MSKKPIYLDASRLLGSGQSVRLAVGFSAVLQRPIVLHRIREHRDNPGLKEHHVLAVRTIAKMMKARIEGVTIGSREIFVDSGPIQGGRYILRLDGQGSGVNVLESALFPAFFAKGKTTIVIQGGMFFPWVHFNACVVPLLRRMGVRLLPFCDSTRIGMTIDPRTRLRPLVLNKRGCFLNKYSVAAGNPLPFSSGYKLVNPIEYFVGRPEKLSVTRIINYASTTFGFDGILGVGKEETTEDEIAQRADSELETSATVDSKTAEQIIPWLAISKSSSFRVSHLTDHLETALWLIQDLLKKQITVRKHSDCVSISSKGT